MDISDMKMTKFGYRADFIRERHARVTDEAKIASRGTDWDAVLDLSRGGGGGRGV